MNVEELKKLKSKLENLSQEYVEVYDLQHLDNTGPQRKLSEFSKMEDTEKFVADCERLFKNEVIKLTQLGISFEQLGITSSVGYLMKPNYLESLKEQFEDDNFQDYNLSDLSKNISLKYVPLSFSFADFESISSDGDIFRVLSREKVSGIVDFNKFVIKMKELGYTVSFLDHPRCNSMADYINNTRENQCETYLKVVVDFSKDKNEKITFKSK